MTASLLYMIASLPLSDPMVPEHDDFRKLLTATSELHKLDCRGRVSAPWRCDAMQRNAIQCILCAYVMSAPVVEGRTARTAVVRRRVTRLPVAPRGAVLAYRR